MPTALIAEDEATVANHLRDRLQALWPELQIVAIHRTVSAAVKAIEQHKPDIAFLDIRMPGGLGIDIPRLIHHRPLYVFITAYDEYAVRAFEASAIDYLLKPIADERLQQTVQRLKERLTVPAPAAPNLDTLIQQLQAAIKPAQYTQWLKAGKGDIVQLVAVEEVCYFKAEDKYTKIVSAQAEYWIRTSLKDLQQELDPKYFQLIHRDTIVRLPAVAQVRRDFAGRLWIKLKERTEELAVSRRHADIFKQM
ncbi:MAG: response regulator transcription factor [Burkholderiales bacterium]|nr:response regulator transcription factor [Burkholderiales bacterium]